MKPHKHAEIIKAWADGYEIEYQWGGGWKQIPEHPTWPEGSVYRIKPEPKPDVVRYGFALLTEFGIAGVCDLGPINGRGDNNIKLTFDGETGHLKAAEVLK